MLTLSLLRHAKSSWDDPSLDDFHRPLAKRGLEAAPRMGAFLARERVAPDLVLCSTAARTRATLDIVLEYLEPPASIVYEDDLYLATPTQLMARIKRLAAERWPHVMIVGHNPGLHEAALVLIASGNIDARESLHEQLPTSGLVVIDFAFDDWRELHPQCGRLERFVTPKSLDAATR